MNQRALLPIAGQQHKPNKQTNQETKKQPKKQANNTNPTKTKKQTIQETKNTNNVHQRAPPPSSDTVTDAFLTLRCDHCCCWC
jgi:hypothetical protein